MTSANGDKRNIPICITLNRDEMEMFSLAKEKLSKEKGTKISGRLLLSVLCFRYLHGNLDKSKEEQTAEDNNAMLEQMKEMIETQIELNNLKISREDKE